MLTTEKPEDKKDEWGILIRSEEVKERLIDVHLICPQDPKIDSTFIFGDGNQLSRVPQAQTNAVKSGRQRWAADRLELSLMNDRAD